MMKALTIGIGIIGFIICVWWGKAVFSHRSQPHSNLPMACVDWDHLTGLPVFQSAPPSERQSLLSRLNAVVAEVAAKNSVSVVLNKSVVVYGVPEITADVETVFLSNQAVVPASGSALTAEIRPGADFPSPPAVGVVNLTEVLHRHPEYPRVAALDREIERWEINHSELAEAVFPPLHWISRGKPDPLLGKALQKGLSAFNLQKSLFRGLKSYADALAKFRDHELAAKRIILREEFTEKMDKEAADLEEQDLWFQERLLKTDQQAKVGLRLKMQVAAGPEKQALLQQLQSLEAGERAQLTAERRRLYAKFEAVKSQEIKHALLSLRKLASVLAAESARTFSARQTALVQAGKKALSEDMEDIKQALSTSEVKRLSGMALPSLEAFQKTSRMNEKQETKVAVEVLVRLREEKARLSELMRQEIEKRAGALAKGRGIPVVLDKTAVNESGSGLSAVDLTQDIERGL